MKVVCVVSQKGGVGKTTVSLNLGYALAMRGWRTLVVDTDPQGGIAGSLTGNQAGDRIRRTPSRPGLLRQQPRSPSGSRANRPTFARPPAWQRAPLDATSK